MSNKDNATNPSEKTNTASRTTNYGMNKSGQLATILMKEANHREDPQKHGALHERDQKVLSANQQDNTAAYKSGVVKFEKAHDAGKKTLSLSDKYSKSQIAGRAALVIGAAAIGGVAAAFAAPAVGAVGAVTAIGAELGVTGFSTGALGIAVSAGAAQAAASIAIVGGGAAALVGIGSVAAKASESAEANKTPAEKALTEQKSVEKDARSQARAAGKDAQASKKVLALSGRIGKSNANTEASTKATVDNLNKAPEAEQKGFAAQQEKQSAEAARGAGR